MNACGSVKKWIVENVQAPVDAFFQIVFLTGEPRFTPDDARTAWVWITSTARSCLT